MIGSKTGEPNAEQRVRFALIFDLGCIACRLRNLGWVAPEQDHRNKCDLAGHARTASGHWDTLGLCSWHHRGIPWDGWTAEKCLEHAGPSKQLHKRRFLEEFGSIEELHQAQEQLLAALRKGSSIYAR